MTITSHRYICGRSLGAALWLVALCYSVQLRHTGDLNKHGASTNTFWLPGANAQFVDKIMLAAKDRDAADLAGLTATYDTFKNFSTHTYDWTSGRWTAPDKQKQWWEGRRPPDHQKVDLYLDENWSGMQTANDSVNALFPKQPYSITFYPQQDPKYYERRHAWHQAYVSHKLNDEYPPTPGPPLPQPHPPDTYVPHGAPSYWRGQNPQWRTADPAHFNDDDFTAKEGVSTFGSQQCRTAFHLGAHCNGSVPVYVPEDLIDGHLTPDGLDLTVAPDSYLTRPGWLGWQWDLEEDVIGRGQAYNMTCNLALRDLIPPLSEQGVHFSWNNTACGLTWRHRPFVTQQETLGPLVYHDAQNTVSPKAVVTSYQALDLYITNSDDNIASPYFFAPYEMWTLGRMDGHPFDQDYLGTYEHMFTFYLDIYGRPGKFSSQSPVHYTDVYDPEPNYGEPYSGLYKNAPCNGMWMNLTDGDTCALSLSPAPPEVWTKDRTCASNIPDGVPIIICRDPDGNYKRLTGYRHDPPRAVPKLRYKAPAKYVEDGSYPTPQGLLPNVACNRATWSKRFGGRCATPVVQYLAYDEAYHTPSAQQLYSIPEYGGCIDGGHMRFIAKMAEAGQATAWDNSTHRSWFIPPMWPFTVWRAAARISSNTEWSKSLYKNFVEADDLNTNQAKLDSLFMHQKVFELPSTSPSSGCTQIKLRRVGRETCLTAPASLTSGMGWGSNTIASRIPCDTNNPLQCFQVEGNLASGARIMHKGLCIGVDPSGQLPGPGGWITVVNLRPCDEGWVSWQHVDDRYIKLAGCKFSQTNGQCAYAWSSYANSLQLYNTRAPPAQSYLSSFGIFWSHHVTQAWDSYTLLRRFWLDSFASSGVDIRAHRIRFVPPGARQGINTRGTGVNQGCGGNLEQWVNGNKQEMIENCHYNTGVTLGGVTVADRDSCMEKFLATANVNGTRAPVCWSGTTWMYQHANKCDRMSSDYRYSMRKPGGTAADKCRSRVGGQYVAVDDLWSFMASERHDPCGWPFLECVPDCSLPSNPFLKNWHAKTDGYVYTTDNKLVGCLNAVCTHPTQPSYNTSLRDPKIANKIGAIDWRNMTLYSANLNFTAFKAKDRFGVSAGEKVWYLNLNFNMLGGDLSQLADLPDIFPNLVHLGLAHCSAGKYAPEYAWQQTQPEMCNELDADGFVNNTACYCPDDSWRNMTIVPNVGAAIKEYETSGALSTTIVRGVTRMFYGSIPQSWGMKNATTPAAWSKTLMSVNLAGHHMLYGELPRAWYNQTLFERLFYLKLKGTKIRADMTRLQWKDTASCTSTNWGRKDGGPNSAGEWVKTCTTGVGCDKCDWWPSRSAAPWYYEAAAKPLTCGDFIPIGATTYEPFPCDASLNYHLNTSALTLQDPDAARCCEFRATCAITAAGGDRFRCTSPGMVFDESKLNSSTVDAAACCKPFVPTCGATDMDGTPFVCPSDGVKYNLVNLTEANPSVAVCCEFVPTCGALYPNKTMHTCTTPGYILDVNALSQGYLDNPPTDALCCTKANCAPTAAGFFPGVHYSCSGGECCFYPVCGAIPQLNENATQEINGAVVVNSSDIASVSAFECPSELGYFTNTAAAHNPVVSLESCCFRPRCGAVDATGAPYTCPSTYKLNPSRLQEPLASDTLQDDATCCYQPTCGANSYTGVPFQCSTKNFAFNTSATAVTDPSLFRCCIPPALVLSQSVGPASGSVLIGDSVNITLTITNYGYTEQVDIMTNMTTLPEGLEYDVTQAPPQGCTFPSARVLDCNPIATLATSATTSYLMTIKAVAVGSYNISASVSEARDSNMTNNGPVQTTVTVRWTCQQYYSNKTAYQCGPMFEANQANAANTNPDQATCCTELFPDLVLSQSVSPASGSVLIGESVNITVTITNQGQWEGVNVMTNMTTLPEGLEYDVTQTPPQGCTFPTAHILDCNPIATLATSATTSYLMSIKAVAVGSYNISASVSEARDSNMTSNGPVQTTITVGRTCQQYYSNKTAYHCGPMFEANQANAANSNPDQATCCTELFPDLVLSQSVSPASGSVLIGESVNITVTITNQGQWEGVNVMTNMTTLPQGLEYDVTQAPAGCTFPSAHILDCTPIATLATSATSSYLMTIKAVAVGSYNISASVSGARDSNMTSNGPVQTTITVERTCQQYYSNKTAYHCGPMFEANQANAANTNPDQATCCTELFPDLVLSQSASPASGSVLIGESVNITVTITNQGHWEGVNVMTNMTTLPDGLEYDVTQTPPQGCTFPNARTLDCTPIGTLATSATTSYLMTIKAVAVGSYNISASVSGARDSNMTSNGPVQTTVTVGRTCQQYYSNASQFVCSTGYDYVSAQDSNPNPSNSTCCQYVPVCGAFWENGTAYQCPVRYQLKSSNLSSRNPSDANCCEYVPVCGAFWENGTVYQCPSGRELNVTQNASTNPDDMVCCQDINGCLGSPCDSIGHAVDGSCSDISAPQTGFTCTCDTGYSWNTTSSSCTDNCVYGNDTVTYCNGHGNGSCTAGICGCLEAYEGNQCQYDKQGCSGDPCDRIHNAVNGSCADVPAPQAGYTCNCSAGYSWNAGTAQCLDFNACASNPCANDTNANHSTPCVDLPPPSMDYNCSCNTGYSWNSTTLKCEDTDGCAGDPCDGTGNRVLGSCRDVAAPGTDYTCNCSTGYAWNAANLTCLDFNACASNPCGNDSNANHSIPCVDLPPPSMDYSCSCNTGYSWNTTSLICEDTDGCAGDPCDGTGNKVSGSCRDVAAPGTDYTCNCSIGYAWNAANLTCLDFNACASNPCGNDTNANSSIPCVDLPPPSMDYSCSCNTGYSWNNSILTCEDTDGCAGDPCDGTGNKVLGSCRDVAAPSTDYTCNCSTGYAWNVANLTCIDFDACASNPCGSDTNANSSIPCVDLPPPSVDYSCSCNTGYSWNNTTLECEDTNGCIDAPCNHTFRALAGTCDDVTAPGTGFTCTCDDGYLWNMTALNCTELNGCANSPCNGIQYAERDTCADLAPPSTAFTCNCSSGYSWNSSHLNCTDTDGCAGDPCDGTGNKVLGSCRDVAAPGTDYTCNCSTGYAWNAANLSCIDFNACASNPCGSDTNANSSIPCVDLPPPSMDHSCSCNTGYSWNNTTLECEDTDGCIGEPCDITPNATVGICHDEPAPKTDYTCACRSGYYWQSSTLTCVEVNGCANSPCSDIPNAISNTCADLAPPSTAFTCDCSTGYSWNNSSLSCTDDCVYGTDAATYCNGHGNGSCTAGVCGCQPAYEGQRCELDVYGCIGDPCNGLPHTINDTCEDNAAPATGHSCRCSIGYSWDPSVAACRDSCLVVPNYCNNRNTSCSAGNCTCSSGWSGTNCEIDVNGCAGDPCDVIPQAVNGSCSDVPAPGTGFNCTCQDSYTWDAASFRCKYIPRCGALVEAGLRYACPDHYEYDPAAANVTTINNTMCCRFVPTCGYYREDGSRFQCPVGRVFDRANTSSTSPDNSTCCRLPHQGACPDSDLRPVLYSPKATNVDPIPILVVVPAQESWAAYCPSSPTSGGQPVYACELKLSRTPMFSDPEILLDGVSSTAPPDGDGSYMKLSYSCLGLSAETCQLQFDSPGDGKWSIEMLPRIPTTEFCDQEVSLQSSFTELIIDAQPPVLVNMTVTKQPTADAPDFQICTTFSEPVSWVPDTRTQATSSTSSNSDTSTDSSTASTQTQTTAAAAAPTAFSSSGILLTNAVLVNISVVPEAVAVLSDGTYTGAASQYCLWLKTWSGATAEVEIIGAAYQDFAGNTGLTSHAVQATAPGSDLWQQASSLASTATAISATASALGATAAAASATGAGGATSILRSVGHTQFLAMSVSLAVPWLPAEYIKLCAGLEWSNLVKPAEDVVKFTSNATAYVKDQLPTAGKRRLASAADASSGSQCTTSSGQCTPDTNAPEQEQQQQQQQQQPRKEWSPMHVVRELHGKQQQYVKQHSSTMHQHPARQLQEQGSNAVVDNWLAGNQHIGNYQASNAAGSSNTGVYFAGGSSTSSNSSRTNSTAFTAAGVTRQPKGYSLYDLRMSILTLAVAVAAASVVQWLLLGLWKLCRLNSKNLPTLLVFPKIQVFVYSLLMVPIIYGAGKLISDAPALASSEASAGIACIVLLPLPVLAFWIYILHMWHTQLHSPPAVQRTTSHFQRTYESPELRDPAAAAAAASIDDQDRGGGGAARSGATLALMGAPDDNPTLIIREKKNQDEDLDLSMDDPISSSPDSDGDSAVGFSSRRLAGSQPPLNPGAGGVGQGSNRPWRSLNSQDGDKGRSSSPAAARGSETSAQGPRAVAEATEDVAELDEDRAVAMAAAWNAARSAGTTSNGGGWGSAPGAAAAEPMLSSGGINVAAQQQQKELSASGGITKTQRAWGDATASDATAVATEANAGSQPAAAAAAAAFLDRYWFLVDDLVGDDKAAAVARVRMSVLLFYIVSTLQRCLTALFFGLYHFKFVSVLQLSALIGVHAAFVVYLVSARPYASNLMLAADVVAYTCELTILGAAVVLKQSPANQKLFTVLVTCYFVDVAIMLVPELVRLVLMAYTWLKRRAKHNRAEAAAAAAAVDDIDGDEDAVVAAVGIEGQATGSKARKSYIKAQQQQQHWQDDQPSGVTATAGVSAPRASDVRGAAGAAAAAVAALSLSESGGKK